MLNGDRWGRTHEGRPIARPLRPAAVRQGIAHRPDDRCVRTLGQGRPQLRHPHGTWARPAPTPGEALRAARRPTLPEFGCGPRCILPPLGVKGSKWFAAQRDPLVPHGPLRCWPPPLSFVACLIDRGSHGPWALSSKRIGAFRLSFSASGAMFGSSRCRPGGPWTSPLGRISPISGCGPRRCGSRPGCPALPTTRLPSRARFAP